MTSELFQGLVKLGAPGIPLQWGVWVLMVLSLGKTAKVLKCWLGSR
ncbi:hypothetical protein L1047_00120 [Synechococcus sp. Nb3U1]|nr:hypothetical protein [Synechococcus sp. Nb3U1]MCF2969604.1 hypothetical protein [Synechococcus sp. Nb3U1]